MKRPLVLAALLTLALLPAPALAQASRKVRMTMPVASLTTMTAYIAQAKGFFGDEGLDVQVTVTGGGGPDIKALLAGEADFTHTAGDQVVLPWQEGARLVIVATILRRPIINWVMRRDVAQARGLTEATPLGDKLRMLRGLTIGVTQPGSLTANLAAFSLRTAGLVPQQDARIIPIGAGPAWVAALEHKKVDVGLMSPPVPDTAIARGLAVMFIENTRGEDPSLAEFLMQTLVTRPDVVQREPDLVRRMVRAVVRASQWARGAPPEDVVDALGRFLKTQPNLLLAGVKSTVPVLSRDGRTTEEALKATLDVMDAAGILKKRPALADIATNDFLPK